MPLEFCKNVLRTSKTKIKKARHHRYCTYLRQKLNKGVYAVNIYGTNGFFAQLAWCISILAHCEQKGLIPAIQLTGPLYSTEKGEDWFANYFETKLSVAAQNIRYTHITHITELGIPDYNATMTIENAHDLFNRYFSVKQEIANYINAFIDENMLGKNVLGIHYRGTDKSIEAPPVTPEYVLATLTNYLAAHPHINALFIASDEEAFIEWIKQRVKQVEIICHADIERSKDGIATHIRPLYGDNYIKGKEALVNSVLLSKCQVLIRTASYLSAWSSVFNPSLPVIMLNKPLDTALRFPDADIIGRSLNSYLPN